MSAPPTDSAARPPRWRRVAAWVLVVLTVVGVTASTVGLWVHRVAFQTDAFMATVTPVVESEAVQGVLSERISDQLTEALDLETRIAALVSEAEQRLVTRIGEALEVSPAILDRLVESRLGLERIAPAVASGIEARIEDAVHRFVSSPEGTQALLSLVEVAHERTVHLLREEYDQLPNLVVTEDEVRFNSIPLIAGALRVVINSGLDLVGVQRQIPPFDSSEDAEAAIARLAGIVGRDLPPNFGQVTIGTGENLERAQDLARLFDRVVWLVLVITIALAAASVFLAPSVRRGIVRVGVAVALGALAGWLILEAIAAGLPDAAATSGGREAIGDITGALVVSLRSIALLLAAIGLLAAVLGMLPTVIPKRLQAAPEAEATSQSIPTSVPASAPAPAASEPVAAEPVPPDPEPVTPAPAPSKVTPKAPRRRRRPASKADEAPAEESGSPAADDVARTEEPTPADDAAPTEEPTPADDPAPTEEPAQAEESAPKEPRRRRSSRRRSSPPTSDGS